MIVQPQRVNRAMPTKRILITGGAGFVGCNAARFFKARNWGVTVLDNLSRQGTDKNLAWLRENTSFDFEQVDIRAIIGARFTGEVAIAADGWAIDL